MPMSRRSTLLACAVALTALTGSAFAQAKLKVAAIYTVPVEQQRVSRIDKALYNVRAPGHVAKPRKDLGV